MLPTPRKKTFFGEIKPFTARQVLSVIVAFFRADLGWEGLQASNTTTSACHQLQAELPAASQAIQQGNMVNSSTKATHGKISFHE